MSFPLQVLDGVVGRRLLQLVLPAEGGQVELEHTAHPGIVRNLEEDVHLMVDVLDELQRGEGNLLQLGQAGFVGAVPQEHGVGFQAVSAGAARFLEVGLGAVGDIGMHHKADVGLVDTHAEGVGAHHHAGAAALPFFLPQGAGLGAQAGVVEGGRYTCGPEGIGQLLRTCPAADIHDAGAGDALADAADLAQLVLRLAHHIAEVGPLEARNQHVGLLKLEPGHDVLGHQRRGGGG